MRAFVRLRLVAFGLIALAALLASPGGVLAAKPMTVAIDNRVPGVDVCGVPTDIAVTGTETTHVQQVVIPDTADFAYEGNVKDDLVLTYTSEANGHVLTNTLRRTFNDVAFADLGGGYWSFTTALQGLTIKLRDGHDTLIQDTGRIVATFVVYFGDPTIDADDFVVSETVDQVAGPHPAHDPATFCAAYAPVMA
jgi:hypothetical protein